MEINSRPNPNEAFPNPKIPSLCFIKNVVKNPRIIIGDYTYYYDLNGAYYIAGDILLNSLKVFDKSLAI